MRFLPLLLLTFLAPLGVVGTLSANGMKCMKDHNYFFKAINDFCTNKDIVVPSNYASYGSKVEGRWAGITGTCKSQIEIRSKVRSFDG